MGLHVLTARTACSWLPILEAFSNTSYPMTVKFGEESLIANCQEHFRRYTGHCLSNHLSLHL